MTYSFIGPVPLPIFNSRNPSHLCSGSPDGNGFGRWEGPLRGRGKSRGSLLLLGLCRRSRERNGRPGGRGGSNNAIESHKLGK